MYNRINLRRCARGFINQAPTSNFTTALLTNPAGGAEYLLVWGIAAAGAMANPLDTSYQQRAAFATTYPSVAILPGDAPPPGILSSGNLLANATFDWEFDTTAQNTDWWRATFPFAVLPPGWSLQFQSRGAAAVIVSVSLFWEAVFPDRLISPYIGDPEIDP